MAKQSIQMNDELYSYLLSVSLREQPVLQEIRSSVKDLPIAKFMSLPEQAGFIQLLVHLLSAKRVLEIGTFIGYMATAIGFALPKDGQLICCEKNAEWAEIAEGWWKKAKVQDKITLILGQAEETLGNLIAQGQAETFDLIFIDADKPSYDSYYELSLELVKPTGLIVIDNTLWSGRVIDLEDQSASTRAIRELNKKIYEDPRVEISLLPMADGMTLVRKN